MFSVQSHGIAASRGRPPPGPDVCVVLGRLEPVALFPQSRQATQRVANSGGVVGYTHLGTADLVAGLKRLPVMAGGNGVVKA